MTWLWYRSKRRGDKAHVFRDGAERSYCGLVLRADAGHQVDPHKVRRCVFCWNANVAPGAPVPLERRGAVA